MNRASRVSVVAALCWAVGAGLVGCAEAGGQANPSSAMVEPASSAEAPQTEVIDVDGRSVNVACSGAAVEGEPVIVLLHGGGDDLTAMAALQQALSAERRVCAYDRLGAGASDQPEGPQDYDAIGVTLAGVLDHVAGDGPVVLAGHSMGGLIAARYAPDDERVRGLVLLDATSPTAITDLGNRIPESATGPAGDLRAQTLAVFAGENPEQLVFTDGEVRSAGDIPVQVIQHGQQYLAEVPEYGPGLEEDWTAGQRGWLEVSSRSELSIAYGSGHYIYTDEPEVAVEAIERITAHAAG
ncbi:alpha/beta fold hydrolase [Allonocardiopsis opalescens]|uniref:Alpha/beta hydrolase family protein n=1 Tax=Allonocardiopsis opalescens TaxID=1144618 RepID=A0A2T0Q2F5_9ACTN|nr:alpha/beta fold hydrolase [Allonocardiopsis opalescens]PRX97969.1 alpha/beta hydrolase family protein [Allonocardiopsis opalescens]